MEKLTAHTPDLTERNIERIAGLFPSVMTETLDDDGNPRRAIDFDLLRQELSDHVVEGPFERYQLDWPGKRAAQLAAHAPIAKTLRPVRAESVDFENTRNIFIEGDNLEALKLLQESYLGKVDLIYIDPPYNRGTDLVYEDNYALSSSEYLLKSLEADESGRRLVSNTTANGRFHSDWLTMMYPRLKLSRDLLSDSGVLIASIDGNELANLHHIGCEIFGRSNLLGIVAVVNNLKGRSDDAHFATAHEYFLAFARDAERASISGFGADAEYLAEFKHSDDISNYKEVGLRKTGKNARRADRPNMFYPIYFEPESTKFSLTKTAQAVEIWPLDSDGNEGCWRWGRDTFLANCDSELTAREVNGKWSVYVKMRDQVDGDVRTVRPKSIWQDPKYDSGSGKREIKSLFGGAAVFDNPKPIGFLMDILDVTTRPDALVLDFFGGSGSTGHAVFEMNERQRSRRRFILIQVDEPTAAGSAAADSGFKTISQLCRERLRRAANRDSQELTLEPARIDRGFRSFRVDRSTRADILRAPSALSTEQLHLDVEGILPESPAEDLLFEAVLDAGLQLDEDVELTTVDGVEVFDYCNGALIACFADKCTPSVIRSIADRQPLRAVFKDQAFQTDAARINAEQLFAELSPSTEVKVV